MIHKGTVRLETERLILRQFTRTDAAAMFRNWANDERVTRYLTWPAHSDVSVSEEIVSMWENSYADPASYQWAIELKELGEPIGSISVTRFVESVDSFEIGYCIGFDWWHKGITSEALRAVIAFLFDEVGAGRVEALHDTENANSGAVMRKCGMRYEGTLRKAARCNRGIVDVCLYSILREEYLQGKQQK